MRVSRSRTSGSTLLRLGGHAMFVGAPIVIGVAMVSLALAYGNSTQLGLGIALLGVGLGIESIRNLYF
jgi:hypothetical protein